ncbi:TlpA family protein disulfide reductase [Moheibacter sediminis]|nr:TlpA disulfide reductase family protein [Moheibacter sediminis]
MKKTLPIVVLLLSFFSHAQFTVTGKIDNYINQNLTIRIFKGPSDLLINKVLTDANGSFTVKVPEKYSGIVRVQTLSDGAILDFLSDNENVDFTAQYKDHQFSEIKYFKGKTAMGFLEYQSFENFNDLKLNVFPMIKTVYSEKDEFYQAVLKEEKRIEKLSPATELSLLKYYVQANDLANAQVDAKPAAEVHTNKILSKLINDNNYLEGSGLMYKLVLDYLRYSIMGATTQEEINSKIETTIDDLLVKTDLETPRGQNVLSSVFLVLPAEQFGTLLEKYYSKANALTCEITDELKTSLTAHNNMVVGNKVPDLKFKQPVKGFKSLYDVKAEKKIVIFWASWCPACNDEMPFVKEYYRNFKAEGGEIISISLDFDKAAFDEATKDFEWINYTELMRWDTSGVKEFGITSTPTLFLLDKDNKLIKKATHISELVQF